MDKFIRRATALVVVAVAAFAAVVSYLHVYDLGRAHGQSGTAARLLPLSVDLLILAASLVALHEVRNQRTVPALARFALWLGIAGTIGANLAYGLPYGPLGAVLSAWPGVAFVISIELMIGLVRRSRIVPKPESAPATVAGSAPAALVPAPRTAPESAGTAPVTAPATALPAPRPSAVTAPATAPAPRKRAPAKPKKRIKGPATPDEAERIFADDLANGVVPSQRTIKTACRVGNDKARELRAHLLTVIGTQQAAA